MLTLEDMKKWSSEYDSAQKNKQLQYQNQIKEGVKQSVKAQFTPQKAVYPEFAKSNVDEQIALNRMQNMERSKTLPSAVQKLPLSKQTQEAVDIAKFQEKNPIAATIGSALESFYQGFGYGLPFANKERTKLAYELAKNRQASVDVPLMGEMPIIPTIAETAGMVASPLTRLTGGITAGFSRLAANTVGKVFPKVGEFLAKRAVTVPTRVGAELGVYSGATKAGELYDEGGAENIVQNYPEVLKEAGIGAVSGAGLGLLGVGVGAAAKKGNKALTQAVDKNLDDVFGGMRPSIEGTPTINAPRFIPGEVKSGTYSAPSRLESSDMITKRRAKIKPSEKAPETDIKALPAPIYRQPPVKPEVKYENKFLNNFSENELNNLEKEYLSEINKFENEQFNYLKSSSGKGVNQGGLIRDLEGNVINRQGRTSNNPLWYQEFWAKNGRKPNNQELREIAKKQLEEGFADIQANVPANKYYISLKNELNKIRTGKQNLSSKSRKDLKQYNEQMGEYQKQSADVTRQRNITNLGRDITQGQIKSNIEQPFKATPGQVTGYAKNIYEAGKPRKFKVENGDINIIRKTPTQVKVPGETISEKLSRLGRKEVYESELVTPETTPIKKVVSNRQIPDINKWTKAEFDEYYGINKQYDPKNIRNLMEDSGARIMNKVGSGDIPTILNYYQKKYKLPFIKIKWGTRSSKKLGETEPLARDVNGNVTGYKVSINPNQSIEGKVATLRHEIEHVIDLQRGFKGRVPKELTKLEQIKMARQTLSEGYVKSQKGEHSKYEWFEADYLRRAAIKDALKAGEKVPDAVLKEYPDLANIKPVKESNLRSVQEQDVPLESQTKSAFTNEINSKLTSLESKHKERINSLKNDKVMDAEFKEKQIKAEGMKYSAKKREIIQGDSLVKVEGGLTEKELADKIKQLKSNYSGKEVITPDGEGIATGQSSFGKVGVKINGEVKYYPKENVQSKIDIDAKIASQKAPSRIAGGQIRQENAQGNINSPSSAKSNFKTQSTSPEFGPSTEKTIGGTPGDGKVREYGYSKNERTNSNSDKTLKENLSNDKLKYMQLGEKGTYKRAKDIFDKGFDESLRYFKAIETYEPHHVPLAHMIANAAAKKGDIFLAREIVGEISRVLVNAGRIGEAARIMRNSDPLAYYGFIQRRIDKFNVEGAKRYGKKWNDLKLSDDIEKEILNLEIIDESTMTRLMEQTERDLAEQMPTDAWEKWDAWRRMAMLLNPKTHARNIAGNAMMQTLRKTSDTLAIPFEKAFLKPGERTKSVFWSRDKNLVQKVTDDWASVKNDLMTNSKYGLETLGNLSQEKRIFKNNFFEYWNKKSSDWLNIEDEFFMGRAYRDALGQYMKANGLKDITETARQYASRRALEATFRQTNELANWLIQGKKKKGFGKLLEAAIPFTKTPLNLAKTAVEYSPGALVKVLFDIKAGPTQVIETLSKGLVGSSLMGLGWWLGSMGWARSNYEKSKKAKGLMEESGDQPYSISTPIGSYTFDWNQPSSLPIAMGVTLAEALSKNLNPDKELNLTRAIGNSLLSAGDAYFNMTVLKNVKDILGGGYQSTTEALASLPIDYLEQGIPAIVGQLSRSIDTKKRITYDPNPIIATGKEAMNRTLLSLLLPENVGILGETKKQPGWYQQFLLPGTGKLKNNDPLVQELNRLYDLKKSTDFLPKVVEKSFDVDNIPVWLKPKEMEEFQRIMGQMNKESMTNAINSSFYQSGSDNYKANRLKTIAENNYTRAKRKILDARGVQTRIKTYNVPIKALKRVGE